MSEFVWRWEEAGEGCIWVENGWSCEMLCTSTLNGFEHTFRLLPKLIVATSVAKTYVG